MQLSPQQVSRVRELLGREPRGLADIPVLGEGGAPVVIRVAALVDDRPFPTLFWLVDRELCYRIDAAEAGGLIARLQARVDTDPALRAQMAGDHRRHIALRDGFITAGQRARLCELGWEDVFTGRGIGGIADFGRIRCLHTWYAAHLVAPNSIGRLLDAHWAEG